MTAAEIAQYFDYHNANIRLLKIGFDHIRFQIKELYTKTNNAGHFIYGLADTNPEKIAIRKIEKSLSRILSGIQVSWAEESIKRLLYERDFLTDGQRTYLINRPALDQKWYETLKLTFCIAYNLVPTGNETCQSVNIQHQRNNLGDKLVDQYFELRRLITDYLTPNFAIRNKVQHGEWEYAFAPPISELYSQDYTDRINQENIITTTSRYTLVNAFYQMLVDMGRFKSNSFKIDSIQTPFEYFYDRYLRKIKFEVGKITTPNLDQLIADMVQRKERASNYHQP